MQEHVSAAQPLIPWETRRARRLSRQQIDDYQQQRRSGREPSRMKWWVKRPLTAGEVAEIRERYHRCDDALSTIVHDLALDEARVREIGRGGRDGGD